MPYNTVVHKTVEYLSVPSVVGHERHFLNYLADDFKKLGLITKRHTGVLEVRGAPEPNGLIISAHIDRHGLISNGDGHYAYAAEYVKEEKYGEANTTSHKIIKAISDRFIDEKVYAYDPKTGDRLGEGTIEQCVPAVDHIDSIFTINGMRDMPIDTPIAYARGSQHDEKKLVGQIDNVVSLGIIYTLFQNGFKGTALFTCEEEIGKSWVHMRRWLKRNKVESQNLIILDTSPYREAAPVEGNMVVLRNRDKSAEFNKDLVEKIKQRATELLIPFQFKDEYFLSMGLKTEDLGSTELGRIVHHSGGRWNGATIQIPTIEYHTSYETTSRGCIESFYGLLHNILVLKPLLKI